jgi:hypothetical protein
VALTLQPWTVENGLITSTELKRGNLVAAPGGTRDTSGGAALAARCALAALTRPTSSKVDDLLLRNAGNLGRSRFRGAPSRGRDGLEWQIAHRPSDIAELPDSNG